MNPRILNKMSGLNKHIKIKTSAGSVLDLAGHKSHGKQRQLSAELQWQDEEVGLISLLMV